MGREQSHVPFHYENEPFFEAYEALYRVWKKRSSQREVAGALNISRQSLKQWEQDFVRYGTVGLLPKLSQLSIDTKLEKLVVLIKSSRPHECASFTVRMANALEIPNVSVDQVRQIQRSYGYGQRMDKDDQHYFHELQHIISSVIKQKQKVFSVHDRRDRAHTFLNYDQDHLQHRVELFKALSQCQKKRMVRPLLRAFGVDANRFYTLKKRYMIYGIWGLADLIQKGQTGEKISPDLELQIIEEKLMNPCLSTTQMITKLQLKCSRAHVQKTYKKWNLAKIKKPVQLRGVKSHPIPENHQEKPLSLQLSAKARFPDLIQTSRLKVNRSFSRLLKTLAYRQVAISNPGAILIAPFLEQLGVVEALHTYGPDSIQSSELTNNVIVNVLRIIAGFPTIHDFTLNSDRSVAIAAGLSLNPTKSRFYDWLDELRFLHLRKLRNDAACRARELGITEGKEIAIDYHCDPSDSRFPTDKSFTRSPDKNGDMVYAHRPQILWDSLSNSIINIAYCEGQSRAPSALYKFCEENLFKIIDTDALCEIYADSEYTGEKQLVYLSIRANADITMCLKQNPKIKKWKEKTIRESSWENYGKDYRIASMDFVLAETAKPFRFIVKQNTETNETRCFGSTHVDYSPARILNSYHLRWPVETGIKDLVENYFLNKPTGTSPEKVEIHYYCIMLARLTIDHFRSSLCLPQWKSPEDWECVLSTMRTALFSNQNCELRLDESGDFMITYLDGDRQKIKSRLCQVLQKRKKEGLNNVSWWGNRGVQIEVKNQYDF
jgi:transcriptional regulator with XRE-family HTH domain